MLNPVACLAHPPVDRYGHAPEHTEPVTDLLDDRLRAALSADDTDALVDVGCDLADAGRQADALRCFERAVALGEDWVWFNVGNTLRELDRPLDAVSAYERALGAGETDAWLNLGAVLERLGDLVGAMDAYRAAADVGDQPEGRLALAVLLREQGERDAAEDALAPAVAAGHLPAVALLACWRWDRTRDPALETDLRSGAEVDGSARADLAELLVGDGRAHEARRVLERGTELGQVECWLPLGNLLCGDGTSADGEAGTVVDEAAAEAAYRSGIDAGDLHCHHNLAVLLLERGEVEEAEAHLLAGAVRGDALAQRTWRELHEDG